MWQQQNQAAPHFVHSYPTASPAVPLQSWGAQGYAPFGHHSGYVPQLMVPGPSVAEGATMPVYHLKVTATPVQIPPGEQAAPKYTVTSHPETSTYSTAGGSVIAHAVPRPPALTIRPLQMPMEPAACPAPHQSVSQLPVEAEHEAIINVYGGSDVVHPQAVLQQLPGAYTHDHIVPESVAEQQAKVIAQGASPLEFGQSRVVTQLVDSEGRVQSSGAGDAEGQERMYSWILPTGKESPLLQQQQAAAETTSQAPGERRLRGADKLAAFLSSIFAKKRPGDQDSSAAQQEDQERLNKYFAQMSEELEPQKPAAPEDPNKQVLSSASDVGAGLPSELRPSVVYGGMEHMAPEFAGIKAPLKYKLHAVEVHQYVPLPNVEDPWILENQLNPATQAIFGPMPMPFDPANSGMVAPCFERTIGNQPAPVLCPELANMFNHELPYVTNIVKDMPLEDDEPGGSEMGRAESEAS